MNKEEKRQYLIEINSGVFAKCCCLECGHWSAVITNITEEEDFGEAKGKFYPMLHYYCLDCKARYQDWEEND